MCLNGSKKYVHSLLLMRTNIQEYHSQQHQRQIDSLGAKVLLMEEGSTKEARHDNRTTTHHRHDRYHGIGQREGIEIHEISCRKENADSDN